MSKDLEGKPKKELVEIILQQQQKLVELQGVEAKQEASEAELSGRGFSVIQDLNEKFQLVEISFDITTGVGKIASMKEIHPSNYEFALFEAKKYLVEKVMNKENLNHLKEKKNG